MIQRIVGILEGVEGVERGHSRRDGDDSTIDQSVRP